MNTLIPIYNGLSIRQILSKMPKNMIKTHRNQYIRNCVFVYKNESLGFNLNMCNLTRNSNFLLIKIYNNF